MKNRKNESDDLINPEFATSIYYGQKPLTESELKSKLEGKNTIYQKFKKYGYILSKEFPFITCATFDDKNISKLDTEYNGKKTQEQKEQAIKMRKLVEDYFIFLGSESIKVAFAFRDDSECALYDEKRFNPEQINSRLIEEYSK